MTEITRKDLERLLETFDRLGADSIRIEGYNDHPEFGSNAEYCELDFYRDGEFLETFSLDNQE